jgi:hypothetical protein
MPRWRVEMLPSQAGTPAPLEVVEAESVAFSAGGALVFSALGLVIRAMAPSEWLQLTLLEADERAGDCRIAIEAAHR